MSFFRALVRFPVEDKSEQYWSNLLQSGGVHKTLSSYIYESFYGRLPNAEVALKAFGAAVITWRHASPSPCLPSHCSVYFMVLRHAVCHVYHRLSSDL